MGHLGHFSCWQCDESLTGQRYVLRDEHPYCVKCYETVFANSCDDCNRIIGIDSKVKPTIPPNTSHNTPYLTSHAQSPSSFHHVVHISISHSIQFHSDKMSWTIVLSNFHICVISSKSDVSGT